MIPAETIGVALATEVVDRAEDLPEVVDLQRLKEARFLKVAASIPTLFGPAPLGRTLREKTPAV